MLRNLDLFLSSVATCEKVDLIRTDSSYLHERSGLDFVDNTTSITHVFKGVLVYKIKGKEFGFYVPQLATKFVDKNVQSIDDTIVADLSMNIYGKLSRSVSVVTLETIDNVTWTLSVIKSSDPLLDINTDLTVRPIDLFLPMSFSEQRICIGSSVSILGASKSGKTTLTKSILNSSMDDIANLDVIRCKVKLIKALIVADEPSLNTRHWVYPTDLDYTFVVNDLTQDKVADIIQYLSVSNQALDGEVVLLNIIFDSISALIYTPDEIEGKTGSTFVKGISSVVRGQLLEFSSMAGYVLGRRQIITLISTVNIPSSGKPEDERAFVNYVSGATIATFYLAENRVAEWRDRIIEFVEHDPSSSYFSPSNSIQTSHDIGLPDSLKRINNAIYPISYNSDHLNINRIY